MYCLLKTADRIIVGSFIFIYSFSAVFAVFYSAIDSLAVALLSSSSEVI